MLEYLKDDKWHNLENGIEEELFKNKTFQICFDDKWVSPVPVAEDS